MSSVQSFLRQRVVGTTTIASTTDLYTFVAGSGNYVGNYPPGYLASSTVVFDGTVVLRDLGKTIKAGFSSDAGVTVGAPGYWRAVQVISPVSVAFATSSTTFGVGVDGQGAAGGVPQGLPTPGGNAGDRGYGTFYIPIVVGGVIAEGVTAVAPPLITGNVL
jgi:hypothetical protein